MLVLTRRLHDEIVINGNIIIKVMRIKSGEVRLGIDAPREFEVYRKEIHDKRCEAEADTDE